MTEQIYGTVTIMLAGCMMIISIGRSVLLVVRSAPLDHISQPAIIQMFAVYAAHPAPARILSTLVMNTNIMRLNIGVNALVVAKRPVFPRIRHNAMRPMYVRFAVDPILEVILITTLTFQDTNLMKMDIGGPVVDAMPRVIILRTVLGKTMYVRIADTRKT